TNYSLTISTKPQTESRSYYKEINLPTAINSDYAKARYVNGILEIKLKKYDEKQNKIEVD
ncbi:MAG: Hsp20/alpha crystallin family protein, partial [Candidatus Lokiarchaeota archaeon]|nr:Hsp20/alpha crystallin family protein [Candidatus Lokiarchaeota archaeon]